MVVDSNFFRETKLDKFLAESPENFAVLTDYSAIEAYKTGNPTVILSSMRILSARPRQVLVLKGTIDCCGIFGGTYSFPAALIDWDQTKHFSEFFPDLLAAQSGNVQLQKQIEANCTAAQQQIERIRLDTSKMLEGLTAIADLYSQNEIRMIRDGEVFKDDPLLRKAIGNSMTLAGLMFSRHPKVEMLPSFEQLSNTFIFRQAICMQVLLFKWIQHGRQFAIGSKKLLNDQVDINFAAYALCFDGLLTNDQKLRLIYEDAKILLNKFAE